MKYSLRKNLIYVYKKAFHLNPKLKWTIPLFIICGVGIPVIASMIPAIAVGVITEGYSIETFIIVMASVSTVYGCLLFINYYLNHTLTTENIYVRLKEFYISLCSKLMRTDYVNVEPQEKKVQIQKALNSINSNWVGLEFMMKNAPTFLVNLIGLVIYSALISTLNMYIILILFLMSVLNYLFNRYAQRYEEKKRKDVSKIDRKIHYLYLNSTSLINGKDVRIYKIETWFYRLFKVLTKKRVSWSKKIEYRYFLPAMSDNIFLFIRDLFAYGILIGLVISGDISVAIFTFYIGIIGGFTLWLHQVVEAYSNLKRANIGVNEFRAYMEVDEVFNHGVGVSLPCKEDYPLNIEFKNVCFRYPGATHDTISNLNLKIEAGSKVALVGNNGAGKTTIVKLLTGLYYPTSGEILINGINICHYNIEEYYLLICAVYQDIQVLAFDIAKNVAACQENEINLDLLYQSLGLAGLKDKVLSLEEKEKTHLTQQLDKKGIMLSGGEMQKLVLARALYRNAPIMVLDEPTSALDPIAEADIYEKYNQLTIEKTSLFISHRLASTKFCDRILFLENGKIVEDGSHTELINQKGKYAEMFDIQSHYYKDGGDR